MHVSFENFKDVMVIFQKQSSANAESTPPNKDEIVVVFGENVDQPRT